MATCIGLLSRARLDEALGLAVRTRPTWLVPTICILSSFYATAPPAVSGRRQLSSLGDSWMQAGMATAYEDISRKTAVSTLVSAEVSGRRTRQDLR